MAYRGRRQLGQEIFLAVLTVDGNGTPTIPDNVPTMKIYTGSGTLVLARSIPIFDRYGTTGLFAYRQFLDGRFASGQYRVTYAWSISGTRYLDEDGFEIVDGGNADGAVLAMTTFVKPQATFIVQDLSSGKTVKGRNPR